MHKSYLWDTNIVLDLLLNRADANPNCDTLYILFIQNDWRIHLAAHELPTIEYVYRRECSRTAKSLDAARLAWELFLPRVTVVKTPATLEWDHPLARHDLEDYQVELAAERIDATIITRDAEFVARSSRCITPTQLLERLHEAAEPSGHPLSRSQGPPCRTAQPIGIGR